MIVIIMEFVLMKNAFAKRDTKDILVRFQSAKTIAVIKESVETENAFAIVDLWVL